MIRPFLRLSVAALITGCLAGCEVRTDGPHDHFDEAPAFEAPGNPAAYDGGSNNCSDEFLQDYKSTTEAVNLAHYSHEDYYIAQDELDRFHSLYHTVVCQTYMGPNPNQTALVLIDVDAQCDVWEQSIER